MEKIGEEKTPIGEQEYALSKNIEEPSVIEKPKKPR